MTTSVKTTPASLGMVCEGQLQRAHGVAPETGRVCSPTLPVDPAVDALDVGSSKAPVSSTRGLPAEAVRFQGMAKLASQATSFAGHGRDNLLRGAAVLANVSADAFFRTYTMGLEGALARGPVKGVVKMVVAPELTRKVSRIAANTIARGLDVRDAVSAALRAHKIQDVRAAYEDLKPLLTAGNSAVSKRFSDLAAGIRALGENRVASTVMNPGENLGQVGGNLARRAASAAGGAGAGAGPAGNVVATAAVELHGIDRIFSLVGNVSRSGADLLLWLTPYINFTVFGMETNKAFYVLRSSEASPTKKGLALLSCALTLATAGLSVSGLGVVTGGLSFAASAGLAAGNLLVSHWRDTIG